MRFKDIHLLAARSMTSDLKDLVGYDETVRRSPQFGLCYILGPPIPKTVDEVEATAAR